MFASVLLPFVDRGSGPLFHWVMLAQMARFGVDDIAFIGDATYFDESAVPFGDWIKLGGLRFQCPDAQKFRAFRKIELAPELFTDLIARAGDSHLALFRHLLTAPDPLLAEHLAKHLRELAQGSPIEAVLSWCNLPALDAAVAGMGRIPVIHNELGPLRTPLYRDTVYFDFRGVNGATSPPAWTQDWVRSQLSDRPLLEPAQLRGLLVADSARVQALACMAPTFRAGVALQVEDDSNIVAYAQGWTQLDLLYDVIGRHGASHVSVRAHPGAHFTYRGGLGQADPSPDSLAFLASIDELVSINSSLLAEAALWGRRFDAKGDTPARFLSSAPPGGEPEWARLALNAFFLAYLVPADLLFDPAYYRWRLTQPTLAQCHERHLAALGAGSSAAIDALPSGASPGAGVDAPGLVRLPALWTGTLSLERRLADSQAELEQGRQQTALRELQLSSQLAVERQSRQHWEAEAKLNWRDRELASERLGELEKQLERTNKALASASDTSRALPAMEQALASERASALELHSELQRVRQDHGQATQELAVAQEALRGSELERQRQQARDLELAAALTALVEWAQHVPRHLNGVPVEPLEEGAPPTAIAAPESSGASIEGAGAESPEPGVSKADAVLLGYIDTLSRRVLALAAPSCPGRGSENHDEQSPSAPRASGAPPSSPMAQVQWVQAQLQALHADLTHHQWRHHHACQAWAELREDIARAGAALAQALASTGAAQEEGGASRHIGELAAVAASHLAQLHAQLEAARARPRTLLERIMKSRTGKPVT